jgi:hypothetical protein
MKHNAQRLVITFSAVFAALAAALLLLSTCFPGPDDYEEFVLPEFTDVEYSPDGGYVTIYLDGSAPVRNSRAINLKWAQIGYDFFEVAFMSGSTVVRSVWETGHAAGVSGVVREVNYGSADPSGASSAILFVGKRSDKTLLGVGRVRGTDDGGYGVTTITANTKAVTFEVAAIDAGVRYKRSNPSADDTPSAPQSSFLTAANGNPNYTTPNETNTETRRVRIGRQYFPAFWFDAVTRNVYAEYTFKVYDPEGTVTMGTVTTNGTFRAGIHQAGPATFATLSTSTPLPVPPSAVYNLDPRYPLGGGDWEDQLWPPMSKDDSTGVTFRNNLAANNNNPFQNPVQFTFATRSGENGNVFAFSFQIPVYPLNSAGSPGTWYLRPGYDSYKYDLDDGEGGTGGAILIGTGTLANSEPDLWIKPPDKEMYPGSPQDYTFDWYGIQAELRIGNDEEYSILKPIISIPPQTGYADYDLNLHFYVKHLTTGVETEVSQGNPGSNNLRQYFLENNGAGPGYNTNYVTETFMLNIIVRYNDSGVIYEDIFPLFWYDTNSGLPSADNIPPENRFVIAAQNELNAAMTYVAAHPGPYIFVFFDSYQIPSVVLSGGSYYIIMIAAAPNVVVGKTGNGNNAFNIMNSAPNSTFFLGKWPFNDTLSVQGLAITSYPLTVNTGTGPGYFLNNDVPITVEKGPGFTTTPNDTYLSRP